MASTLTGCGGGSNPDTSPPFIVDFSPSAGSTYIDHETSVKLIFNEGINHATVTSNSFALRDASDNLINGTYQFSDDAYLLDGTVVRFIPTAPLAGNSLYHVTVTTAITNDASLHLENDLGWSFTTAPAGIGSWVPISSTEAPPSNYHHTAVWTGTEMLVWGRTTGTSSGYRYNPATDTWTTMSSTNAPSPRTGHTAVWTGNEMIIWGGRVGTDYTWLNDGARYNPATDTWTTLSSINTPEARAEHTAIWTGDKMIIWGGSNGGYFATYPTEGGIYDPLTDSWQSISLTNAPAGRTSHGVVWTGVEMIVWGGKNSVTSTFNYLANGGRYSPTADTWNTISLTVAPAARAGFSAIWTGTEMIVWGGFDDSQFFASGARYDPITDTWVATTQTDTPLARYGHAAVWSGAEMIVWGGYTGIIDTLYPRFGGRYDPVTDTWQFTTTLNAPLGRPAPSAIWTGSDMIVWGGDTDSTGGIYTP